MNRTFQMDCRICWCIEYIPALTVKGVMMCHSLNLYHFWVIVFGYFLLAASVAVVKSRDLHWGLLATKDHKEVSLSSLRLLLVADGANPWSLSSCDQFLSVFQAKGLRPDAICPCASSSECLTVSVRR